jgi:hypothetical protein
MPSYPGRCGRVRQLHTRTYIGYRIAHHPDTYRQHVKSAGIRGQPPRLAANVATPLMEPKELLEHVNLEQSTMQLGRKGAGQRSGKANIRRGPNADQGKLHSQTAENVSNKSTDPFRKNFTRGRNQKDRGPPTSSK